jgi:hypothetical protein
VALVLATAWNVSQRRAITALQTEQAELGKKIAAASVSGPGSAASPFAARSTSAKRGGGGPIDWKALASQVTDSEGDDAKDLHAMLEFEQRVGKMSKDEILSALDEVAGLEMSDEARDALESLLIEPLIEQDPELALRHFADRIANEPDGIGWQLATALQEWAKKDLAGATAWFNQQIAAGTFDSKTLDGRSDLRIQYEGALLGNLLGVDVNAAGQRLAAMPEDQRREILQQISFDDLTVDQQRDYAALVREHVPESEREGSFAHIASEVVDQGGYSGVSAFLDSVNASPAERVAAAREAAEAKFEQLAHEGNITADDVDKLRTWLGSEAPGLVDSITGKAIAEAAQDDGKFTFEEASKLALKYNQNSKNDDVLVAFLKSYDARSNLDLAKHLAEMIKDPQRRSEVINHLD